MSRVIRIALLSALAGVGACVAQDTRHPLVLATDFGEVDGAVSAMKGVALAIDPALAVHDLTHEIAPFDVWEGAFRIAATAPFWPAGSVIVGVVDPGVGTDRAAIVVATKSGHYFVGPDNGLFSVATERLGLAAVRTIDIPRFLRGDSQSHTFHGRDLFAVVGARLAAGELSFAAVGPLRTDDIVRLEVPAPTIAVDAAGRRVARGCVSVLDARYGNVWTNVPTALLDELGVTLGSAVAVRLSGPNGVAYDSPVPYVTTFGAVPEGSPLLYVDSEGDVALALNMGDFAATHRIASGPGWLVELRRADP